MTRRSPTFFGLAVFDDAANSAVFERSSKCPEMMAESANTGSGCVSMANFTIVAKRVFRVRPLEVVLFLAGTKSWRDEFFGFYVPAHPDRCCVVEESVPSYVVSKFRPCRIPLIFPRDCIPRLRCSLGFIVLSERRVVHGSSLSREFLYCKKFLQESIEESLFGDF